MRAYEGCLKISLRFVYTRKLLQDESDDVVWFHSFYLQDNINVGRNRSEYIYQCKFSNPLSIVICVRLCWKISIIKITAGQESRSL